LDRITPRGAPCKSFPTHRRQGPWPHLRDPRSKG
jgi:hypothetical protein